MKFTKFVRKWPVAGVALLLCFILAGCGGNQAEGSQDAAQTADETEAAPETLRLAVTDLVGLEELQRNFEPFQEQLSEILDTEVELFPVSNRTAAATALSSDRVDVVLTGPAEYVVMRANTDAVPIIGITRPGYYSVIAVQAESEFQEVSDLEGETIAMSDAGSTSGHLGPCLILRNAGLDCQSDVEVLLLGDTDLQAFSNEEAPAWGGAALDLELFTEESENVSESDYRILKEGDPLPNDVFIASSELSPEYVEQMRTRMRENEGALIDAILQGSANEKYDGAELVDTQDSDYDRMREAYRAIGVDDFSEFVGEG